MSAARGISAGSYVEAGQSAVDNTIGTIRAARRNAPDYGAISSEGIKQRAATKAAGIKAESDVAQAGIRAEAAVRKSKIQADRDKSLVKSKATVRKAGKIAAAGTLIGDNITEGHKAARKKEFYKELSAKHAELAELRTKHAEGQVAEDTKKVDELSTKTPEPVIFDSTIPNSEPQSQSQSQPLSQPAGDFNSSTMMTYLTGKGLSDIHAKGLVINAMRESGLNPTVGGGDSGLSDGLFQWYKERRDKMKSSLGKDWGNPYKQLDYLWQEDKSLSIVGMDDYKAQDFKSVQEASDWFMRKWERPADPNRDSLKHTSFIKQQGWG